MSENKYYKFLSFFLGFKPGINELELKELNVKLRKLEFDQPAPDLNNLSKTYTLIRKLLFHPEIRINIMESFKSLLKWKELNMHYSTTLRDYPLGFDVTQQEFLYEDLHLPYQVKITEEIIQVLPYVRKVNHKKLYKLPCTKRPIYKSYFSKEEMRLMREKIAAQNKTGWANIEVFEIYDKFHYNLFSNIKQISGGKELECTPNISQLGTMPEEVYYLVIARKRDTGEPLKAIINPADIKLNN